MTDYSLKEHEEFCKSRLADTTQKSKFIDVIADGHEALPQMLLSALGAAGESGEIADEMKKVLFHGKPYTEELRTHIKEEMGDLLFYIAIGCDALDTNLVEIAQQNYEKLTARFPEGKFTPEFARLRLDEK